MNQTSRRRFIQRGAGAAASAAWPLLPKFAHAAEFTYKYGNTLPPTHPMNIAAKKAADKIREETRGRFEIQVFPSSQLGADTDMLSQVRSGALEFYSQSGLVLASIVPAAGINGIGFAFKDYEAVWSAMDGDLGAFVRGEIEKVGLLPMRRMWDNGFRQVTSGSKPIASPTDLRGFKIRVPVSPVWVSLFKAFGAAPASINFSELYTALQTKVVDGQENPVTLLESAKLYEVQRFCSLTNHMWDGFWFLANKRAWERLPADVREVAERNIDAAGLEQRAMLAEQDKSARAKLEGFGMKFNQPDTAAFRDVLKQSSFYAEWRGKFGDQAWAVLEKYSGKLG
ncbi:MAG TPA: TRAP transporter substrate-binding protein [Burkholderiaceae bacterium]|nr:TRAP transporter substrate-binding protein [Burkholderiaceae bacterium]